MGNIKDLYNSIIFIEQWQNLIREIRDLTISKLNKYSSEKNINIQFSKGTPYPDSGIHYGSFINFEKNNKKYSNVFYFGFNFNLYQESNIASYPSFSVVGDKLNDIKIDKDKLPSAISTYLKAKKDELIDEYIFGVALQNNIIKKHYIDELRINSIEDIENYYYIPIETHLLYNKENIDGIATQILNICIKFLFTEN